MRWFAAEFAEVDRTARVLVTLVEPQVDRQSSIALSWQRARHWPGTHATDREIVRGSDNRSERYARASMQSPTDYGRYRMIQRSLEKFYETDSHAAFDAFAEAVSPWIRRTVSRLLGRRAPNRHEIAESVTNSVLWRVFESASTPGGQWNASWGPLREWLRWWIEYELDEQQRGVLFEELRTAEYGIWQMLHKRDMDVMAYRAAMSQRDSLRLQVSMAMKPRVRIVRKKKAPVAQVNQPATVVEQPSARTVPEPNHRLRQMVREVAAGMRAATACIS
jgi:hypothetical protein